MKSSAVVILNMFKGSMELVADKWCRIEAIDTNLSNFVVKEGNTLSLKEYELIRVVEQ
ncbi:hypothetical protein ES319_D09G083900v1 [Gossypium barbadense]|uniref:Uncharacterized protein n=2 Tax=Gossypium TaxID=3633 RepID=A0A5J5Q351_GOSBA|nr:hypothetical protein ES319_D09G083900v1 [Gossypium barbadense]KAB2012351.1 hypothetical protein ES319_D09G083900v1 [Gossypium barbadense]TYG53288.1 hypothetical protein ES288_D09G097700v1 [Gossypium darwinii]